MNATPISMDVDCYRITVPRNSRLAGYTATGQRVKIAPGEHVVHRMLPNASWPDWPATLRFLGADRAGRDVYVRLEPGMSLVSMNEACISDIQASHR